MQDTMAAGFKAVAIFGHHFAVRAKGADKTVTRQADTERTAQTNVPPQPPIFPHFCRFYGNFAAPYCVPTGLAIYLTDRNSSSHAMRTSTTDGRDGSRA